MTVCLCVSLYLVMKLIFHTKLQMKQGLCWASSSSKETSGADSTWTFKSRHILLLVSINDDCHQYEWFNFLFFLSSPSSSISIQIWLSFSLHLLLLFSYMHGFIACVAGNYVCVHWSTNTIYANGVTRRALQN